MSIKEIYERDTVAVLPMKHICSFAHNIVNSAENGRSLQKLPAEDFIKS